MKYDYKYIIQIYYLNEKFKWQYGQVQYSNIPLLSLNSEEEIDKTFHQLALNIAKNISAKCVIILKIENLHDNLVI